MNIQMNIKTASSFAKLHLLRVQFTQCSHASNSFNYKGSHALGYKKIPGLFHDPRSIFPEPCCKPAMFKYSDKQQLQTIYTVIHNYRTPLL